MKRGTPEHPKMKKLARRLGVQLWGAIGIMEAVWHFVQRFAPCGDIGKYTNEEIAEAVDWTGDADKLVQAMTETGWLDRSNKHRLIVHDWPDHCDRSVTKYLKDNGLSFAQTDWCASHSTSGASQSEVRAPSGSEPEPHPEPKPAPYTYTEPVRVESVCDGDEDSSVGDAEDKPIACGPIPVGRTKRIYDFYPVQKAPDEALAEIEAAVRRVQNERRCDVPAALTWLESRVKAYARSGEVRDSDARFVPYPAKWFKQGRYNEPDSSWVSRGSPTHPTTTDADVDAFANDTVRRVMDRMERQEKRAV